MNRRYEEEELVEYVSEKYKQRGRFVLAGIFGILGIGLVTASSRPLIGVVFFALMAGFVIYAFYRKKKQNEYFDSMLSSKEAYQILKDFWEGSPTTNGQLRMGEKYLFPKGQGVILKYSDIAKVYQSVHSTNGMKDSRVVKAELTDGKTVTLCNIAASNRFGTEEFEGIAYPLLKKNPEIHIGYR